MELVSLGMEVVQNIAEHAASYRLGQSALRQLDRALWVVEKCARWAVPPPLEQDERQQPELVRPLPWLFFLMMLITLRVTREAISLANLVMGKPPLRSVDVVIFIQGKRRYLRTLKYQGNRMMRARTSSQPQQPWYNKLHSLFELTMCFRRQSQNYGNNNTTRVTNNDEVVVIKRTKSGRNDEVPVTTSTETPMERLIEKMMLDLDAESDEDSAYTLTNASLKSDISECAESDQDIICQQTLLLTKPQDTEISQTNGDDIHFSPKRNENSSSTPEKTSTHDVKNNEPEENDTSNQISHSDSTENDNTITDNSYSNNADERLNENVTPTAFTGISVSENANSTNSDDPKTSEDSLQEKTLSPKQETENSMNEATSYSSPRPPKKDQKIANGRTVKSVPSKKKGITQREKRGSSNEVLQQKVLPSHSSF